MLSPRTYLIDTNFCRNKDAEGRYPWETVASYILPHISSIVCFLLLVVFLLVFCFKILFSRFIRSCHWFTSLVYVWFYTHFFISTWTFRSKPLLSENHIHKKPQNAFMCLKIWPNALWAYKEHKFQKPLI